MATKPTPAPAPAKPTFKRVAAVTLPTLKVENEQTVYIRVLHPILEKRSEDQVEITNPDGTKGKATVEKIVNVATVQNLQDGEQYHMVLGAILATQLKDYKGGNSQYVGMCFEVTKLPPRPGKRAKDYSIHQIEDPDHT